MFMMQFSVQDEEENAAVAQYSLAVAGSAQ